MHRKERATHKRGRLPKDVPMTATTVRKIRPTIAELLEKEEKRIAEAKARKARLQGKLNEQARKERTRKLIQVGALAEMAGILGKSEAYILGALMAAAKLEEGSEKFERVEAEGRRVLNERAAARRKEQVEPEPVKEEAVKAKPFTPPNRYPISDTPDDEL